MRRNLTVDRSVLLQRIVDRYLGDPTVADAIMDGLLHNAHRIVLKGPSRRKEKSIPQEP